MRIAKLFGLGAALGLLALFTLAVGHSGQVGFGQAQPSAQMVLIPAGSFQMGDSFKES